jgi:hypothetical protein
VVDVTVVEDQFPRELESIPPKKANGLGTAPAPAVEPLPTDDPFAASNFAAAGEEVPTSTDDSQIDVGVPSDEDFVYVSSDPRHYLKATFLIVKATEGFGKTHFLLTPKVAAWIKTQPSLKKFVKVCHVYLYKVADGGYGLWLIKDSLDNWSVSELAVVNSAKKMFTRRYNDGKLRKGHTSDAIPTADVVFPDRALTGADGLLKVAFGEAFAIADVNHPTILRLLGKN